MRDYGKRCQQVNIEAARSVGGIGMMGFSTKCTVRRSMTSKTLLLPLGEMVFAHDAGSQGYPERRGGVVGARAA